MTNTAQMVVVRTVFGSSEGSSYVQLVAVANVIPLPVDVENKIHMLSKRLIREVTSHTEIYD